MIVIAKLIRNLLFWSRKNPRVEFSKHLTPWRELCIIVRTFPLPPPNPPTPVASINARHNVGGVMAKVHN